MDVLRITRMFYLGFTLYVILLLDLTSIKLIETIPALTLLWFCFISFTLGFKINKNEIVKETQILKYKFNIKTYQLLFISFLPVLFSILSVRFYTGQTPDLVINNLLNGISLYYEYQNYFKEQNLGVLSIDKIPYIFMFFFVKAIFFISYIYLIIIERRLTLSKIIYLCIVTLSFIYIGIARGTNFEFFEIAVMIIFIIFSKYSNDTKFKLPVAAILKSVMLVFFMIYIFQIVLIARGTVFEYYISKDISFNHNSIFFKLAPLLSYSLLSIYSYFGFGFFYTSKFITDVLFSSIPNLTSAIIPVNFWISSADNKEIMLNLTDFGVKWHPDSTLLISTVGILGLLIFCYAIGYFAGYINSYKNKNTLIHMTSLFILLQMISLPVGNFISTSSANQLIAFALLGSWSIKFVKVHFNRNDKRQCS